VLPAVPARGKAAGEQHQRRDGAAAGEGEL
jgi:hypothetical protein